MALGGGKPWSKRPKSIFSIPAGGSKRDKIGGGRDKVHQEKGLG